MFNPQVRGRQYITTITLVDQANGKLFKVNPTLAAGDVRITTDYGTEADLTTLPTVSPAGSWHVKVTVSATEMNGDNISIVFHDVAGAEWCDFQLPIQTNSAIGGGTVTTGATSTSVPTSAFAPVPSVSIANQFNGRILLFDNNTATVALRGSGGPIVASTAVNPPTFTLLDALPVAPASGDTFKVY